MLDIKRIVEVIEANLFEPVTEETRQKIALSLGIPVDSVLLGSRVISIIDGKEVYRFQVTETGGATHLETDIELAEAVLNDAVQRDPVALWLLINNRIQTNVQMAQSGTILPGSIQTAGEEQFTLSALDLLNGVLYAMSGFRLVPRWDTTNAQKGEVKFNGFQISKAGPVAAPLAATFKGESIELKRSAGLAAVPPGTADFGSSERTVHSGGTH